jgi:hypothetical protein
MVINVSMVRSSKFSQLNWLILACILLTQMIILWISPEERTLGVGIKPVYLHVSLTWTGMLLLFLSGLIGIAVVVSNSGKFTSWLKTIFSLAVGFFISIVASFINWGGVPVREPKVLTALNVVVVSGVVWVLTRWIHRKWIIGVLSLIPVLFVIWTVGGSRMVLHPGNPVNSSPDGIRFTFYSLFFLAILLAGWFFGYLRGKEAPR